MDIFWAKSWKIGQNQFFGRGFFFSQKKWGTNKIEYVCICHGHPWVSGQNSIPTFTNYERMKGLIWTKRPKVQKNQQGKQGH